MGPAQIVIQLPQDESGILNVLKFAVTVKIGTVKLNVGVNVGLVHMGGHHKLVLAFGEFHSQLIANVVGLLRGDLAGFEGLDDAVHEYVVSRVLSAPSELEIELFAGLKLLGGGLRQTHKGGHQLAVDGFFRFLIVVQAVHHEPPVVAHGFAGV